MLVVELIKMADMKAMHMELIINDIYEEFDRLKRLDKLSF